MNYAKLTVMKTVHDRLIEARKAAGFKTAQEAVDAMGISYPTYAGHENGSAGIRSPVLAKYAKKFRVSTDWLLTGIGDGPKGTVNRSIDRQLGFLKPHISDLLHDQFETLIKRELERDEEKKQ